ncbi:N-acetylmuramoyl-L-alanine amidase [Haloactinospora alba]|uniref:N-acetylmuramoyl-L-alanine amidase n=1 Tax=Haloactinospora alba TaxID=405555 RepID=A0A543N6T0_9ACTN|nr:N-acetylmuramoyl-L-alanine amidase [Haloactinospora alba]TQN27524.1 N-acetylmuramoyl-L-alanine amidase [Haloactinospora alba]
MRHTHTPTRRFAPPVLLTGAVLLALTGCSAVAGDDGSSPEPPTTDSRESPDSGDGNSTAPPTEQGPLSGTTIVVDPGHNGGNADAAEEIAEQVPSGPGEKSCDTVGAETADGYHEHEFTWDLARVVRDELESDGAEVVLTREDNDGVGPCVNERAEIGNDADADAAVSIHADGASGGSGFHVITPGEIDGYSTNADIIGPSRQLAEDVRTTFREEADQPYADYIGEEGIDERTDLGGLNLSTVPKVFLEVGNMRDPDDAEKITDSQWRERAGAALASGLAHYARRD